MNRLKISTWLAMAALAMAACGPLPGSLPPAPTQSEATAPVATTGEIKIALLAPLSGPEAAFGVSTRDGALMAVNEWNAKSGLLGQRILVVIEDSGCARDAAAKAANKVIDQDKVRFIIGEVCSGASVAISEIANARRVIQISPTSTEPALTVGSDGQTKRYVFRACFIDEAQAQAGAAFAHKTLKAGTAFILTDAESSYSKGLSEVFAQAFEAQGGKVVGQQTYHNVDTDFSAAIGQIAQVRPDIVYLPDDFSVANLVTRQAKDKGIAATFLGGDGWDSADLDPKAVEGSYFTDHFWPGDPRPDVQKFIRAYGAQYKDAQGTALAPNALAALAYDATNLLLQAIRQAGTADNTDKIADSLANISYSAVSGRISFNADHNPVKPVVIVAVKGGRLVFDSSIDSQSP
jgi:branched-chain amino acid transport system substrate-binding protein